LSKRYPEFTRFLVEEDIILAFSAIFGFLGLLQGLGVSFPVFQGGAWVDSIFYFGTSMQYILVVLCIVLAYYAFDEPTKYYLVFPVLFLFLFRGLNVVLNLSIVCIFLVFLRLIYSWDFDLVFFWVLFFGSIFMVIVFLHWCILVPIGVEALGSVASIEMLLYFFWAQYSPYLCLILVIFSIFRFNNRGDEGNILQTRSITPPRRTLILIFLGLMVVYISLYQFLPNVNPHNIDVSIDFNSTQNGLSQVQSTPTYAFKAVDGQRPFFFLSLLIYQRGLGLSTIQAVRYFPVLLNLLLLVASYVCASYVFRDDYTSLLCSIFMVFGVPVVAGVYSGVLANLLALSLSLISIGLFFKYIYERVWVDLAWSSLIAGLVLFTHPWTFYQYIGALCFLIAYKLVKNRRNPDDFEVKHLVGYLVSLGVIILTKFSLSSILGGGNLIPVSSRLTSLSTLWPDLVDGSLFIYGGILSNTIILVLSIYYIIKIRGGDFSRSYFSVLMLLTSLLWFIGDGDLKSRLIFNSPLWLLSAAGLSYFYHTRKSRELKDILLVFVVVSVSVYALRSIANLF
jgi:hypothetical protein